MKEKVLYQEIADIEKEIVKTEKELLAQATENIKSLYLKIDNLCCLQKVLENSLNQHLSVNYQ